MQKIHLLCGQPGAGKTTFGCKLTAETGGIHLLMDECMKPLYFPDSKDETFTKYVVEPKAFQCAAKILEQAEGCLRQGQDVILDLATFEKKYRDFVRDWARRVNAEFVLYWIQASRATRRQRVLDRNRDKGTNFSFNVPEWAFDYMDAKFEAPTELEHPVIVDTDRVG